MMKEVDFLDVVGHRPWFAVEAKAGDESPSPHLRYFGQRLGIPYLYQVVADGKRDFVKEGVRVLPAPRLLAALP